ncbi:MerR family transcriptional regulator [Microbacterium sp. A93]|uniref:MerR family transcriptional regulator n=1 Tax=unclassified Microbacterium TaxID=2609290 RepID=UPI003F435783
MTQFRESDGLQRRVSAEPPLQTISTFARAVGLSASALRQYADSGLLSPADVEERTGYRYYALDQQQRAIWIRRLRDAGLRLERIRAVFENDAASADSILDEWLAEAHERAESAGALVDDLKLSLRAQADTNPTRRTTVRFDGMVLASAIRQVMPASLDAGDESGLDGVLLEVEPAAVAIVATDRYILLTRTNLPAVIDGPSVRVRISPSTVVEWVRTRQEVDLIIDVPAGRDPHTISELGRFRDLQGEELVLSAKPDRFPSVHRVLATDPLSATRAIFQRDDVLRLAEQSEDQSVLLAAESGCARLSSGALTVSGYAVDSLPSLEISTHALRRIVEAVLGHELTCDVRGQDRALVWRSPAQPDFAALVMPRRA